MNQMPAYVRLVKIVGIALMPSLLTGCDDVKRVEPALAAEPWAKLPPNQWPQIVLTNSATFRGHTPLQGASAFLYKAKSGRIYGATVNHLLGENGGVEPTVTRGSLDSVLTSWALFPRTQNASTLSVEGLALRPKIEKNNDWLILRLKNTGYKLPAAPLRFRPTPVAIGERVHLVGVPYSEPAKAQNVYTGTVTEVAHGDRFRYSISPTVNISGFSGAPILDENGLVVGVMTVWFTPKMDGKKMMEAGGETVASVIEDGPTL